MCRCQEHIQEINCVYPVFLRELIYDLLTSFLLFPACLFPSHCLLLTTMTDRVQSGEELKNFGSLFDYMQVKVESY